MAPCHHSVLHQVSHHLHLYLLYLHLHLLYLHLHLLPPPPSPSSTCTSPQVVGRADGLTLMETADPLLLLIAVVYLSTAIVSAELAQSNKGPRGVGCSPLAAAVTSGL